MSGEISTDPEVDQVSTELAQIVEDIAEGRDRSRRGGGADRSRSGGNVRGRTWVLPSGKYAEALEFFNVLCLCRQTESRFWFGLGATSQMLGDAATALRAYGMAAVFDITNPQISLRAAECLVKLGDVNTARTALEAAMELAEGKPEHAAYRERARLVLQQLDRAGAAA